MKPTKKQSTRNRFGDSKEEVRRQRERMNGHCLHAAFRFARLRVQRKGGNQKETRRGSFKPFVKKRERNQMGKVIIYRSLKSLVGLFTKANWLLDSIITVPLLWVIVFCFNSCLSHFLFLEWSLMYNVANLEKNDINEAILDLLQYRLVAHSANNISDTIVLVYV